MEKSTKNLNASKKSTDEINESLARTSNAVSKDVELLDGLEEGLRFCPDPHGIPWK